MSEAALLAYIALATKGNLHVTEAPQNTASLPKRPASLA
jgi:hypothetical protein